MAGCAAVLFATAAACGTVENLTAGQKVDHAVDRLGEQKSLAFGLSLDATPKALASLAGDTGPGEEVPEEFTDLIAGLHVDVSVKSRKKLADSGEKDLLGTSVRVAGPKGVLVEYRAVGDYMYYRADLKALGDAMGFPFPTADELPEEEKGFKKVLEGEWAKVDARELEKSGKGTKGSGDEVDAKTQQKVMKAVRGAITDEVTFRDKGESDGAEHVVAKAGFRDLLTELFDRLRPLQGDLPPGAELPTAKDLKEAPDKKVAVDFRLKDGDLEQVRVDLAVLADKPNGTKLPLVLKFSEAGDVSAPKGATELPADELRGPGSPFAGGMLGGGML
ncbi:hypothetical protein ACFYP4_24370 [Streptomyces sp. NPDC005551]|uniref:hypothetical protein n=1 Tax=unclassified Streptomyces TaxID=2593676 RepID=UPI00340ED333